MTTQEMIAENRRRKYRWRPVYNPETGRGACGLRERRTIKWEKEPQWLPKSMIADAKFGAMKSRRDYLRLRIAHDFEFWAVKCVKIHNKLEGGDTPFVLNAPQRRVLGLIEADRLAERPLRLIMLKARQWGGSTLIQMYFAWIQCVLKRSWHSLICAHVRGTAAQIRSMYSRMLADYPKEFWLEEEAPKLKAFEGMKEMKVIAGRDCQVTLASSFNGDSMRGLDFVLAHLSEVAYWKDSDLMKPEEMVRAVNGGIPMVPLSFVAIESTANGMGNFFHSEWQKAKEGRSEMRHVFVPWYEIESYRTNVKHPSQLIATLDEYERKLWDKGLTLDQIAWYRAKLAEMPDRRAMNAEYPTDDVEAFSATDMGVFAAEDIEKLRRGCEEVLPVKGEMTAKALTGHDALQNVRFIPSTTGTMEVWDYPDTSEWVKNRYIVAVDVGGRTAASDWSVISVLDRLAEHRPAIVAQWRGHCDHDLLGWRAAMTARWYGNALLVIESNSLESSVEGNSRFILEQINGEYPNLYARERRDSTTMTVERRLGFHTNYATKTMAITNLIAAVRDGAYTERSPGACNEMGYYEQQPNGSYGAKAGYHDDILMTRAIALYVASQLPPAVVNSELKGMALQYKW